MRNATPWFILGLLAAACFTLAAVLQPAAMRSSQGGQDSVLKILLGDGRRVLANHLFTKADVYFHSGYYPGIFDHGTPRSGEHLAGHDEEKHEEGHDHDDEPDFLGPPRDFFERIGRHAMITEHTHLENGNEREILPWLKLSAELDPHKIDSYTVAAYWLANRLGKAAEAEQFLHEGLRQNPESYEILLSLGRIYLEHSHDEIRAANVWELALRRWREQEPRKEKPNTGALFELTLGLGRIEERRGNLQSAIRYLEEARTVSPDPHNLGRQIEELRVKLPPGAK